jgi:Zn-dependent M28 family amino/carboxypeptidase
MPGKSWSGDLPPLDESERALAGSLERHVRALAADIGERNVMRPSALTRAAEYVARELEKSGRSVERQRYRVGSVECENLEIEIAGAGRRDEIVVVGAHYDSAPGTPGADDNASGTAALFELASRFASRSADRTLRFVAFVNEEPPHFQTTDMGSLRYAGRSRERKERVVAMLSLESIGYFSTAEGSQKYPPPLGFFYPSRGDFIAFVGNPGSRALVRRTVGTFRDRARFPCEGAAVPGFLPGVGWSDHWSFWQHGYPAVMVTDTAPFRNPNYHQASDTPDRVDYERLARVVIGLDKVIEELLK